MPPPARPSLAHATRVRRTVATLAALGCLVVAILALTGGLAHLRTPTVPQVPDEHTPWDYTTTVWDQALGGDQDLTAQEYTTLAAHTDPDLDGQADAVRALATQVARADLTGRGKEPLNALAPHGITPYWPTTTAPAQCSEVNILAAAPAHLPVTGPDHTSLGLFTTYAKTLVAFTGTCADREHTITDPGIRYIYAGRTKDTWVPLRYWQIPVDPRHDTLPGATEPHDWELKQLTGPCAPDTVVRARIAVVDAFTQMCTTAADEGVTLTVDSGYRTRAEQATLFANAVTFYGSVENARRHVAYADDQVCTSRHCSGLALNLSPTPQATQWLTRTAGCVAPDGTVTEATDCPPGATPVPNMARFGFAAPLATSPGYLEFTLPMAAVEGSSLTTPNCNPAGLAVPNQVTAIFRCRLAREGIVGPEQDRVVAEAVTVARCESGWNPTAAAFGGRFATTPHPQTGQTYTHQGVFMLTTDLAQAGWVRGGVDALRDPVANINAAASLWLTSRSWDLFGCATGADTTFQAGPALPQYGGPDLPDWAHQY